MVLHHVQKHIVNLGVDKRSFVRWLGVMIYYLVAPSGRRATENHPQATVRMSLAVVWNRSWGSVEEEIKKRLSRIVISLRCNQIFLLE